MKRSRHDGSLVYPQIIHSTIFVAGDIQLVPSGVIKGGYFLINTGTGVIKGG
jgi:hypothetical protein